MTDSVAKPKRPAGLLIWLILSQLLAAGSLLIWVYLAGMAVFAFDEGQSPLAWTIVLVVWAYPLFPLSMAIGAWVAFAFHKNRLAAVLSGISFVPPLLFALIFWISQVVMELNT